MNTTTNKKRGFDAEWAAESAILRQQFDRMPRERFKQSHERLDRRLDQEDAFEQIADAAQGVN
jgi:hypothetical protein